MRKSIWNYYFKSASMTIRVLHKHKMNHSNILEKEIAFLMMYYRLFLNLIVSALGLMGKARYTE